MYNTAKFLIVVKLVYTSNKLIKKKTMIEKLKYLIDRAKKNLINFSLSKFFDKFPQ
jgi:hypothetical protein